MSKKKLLKGALVLVSAALVGLNLSSAALASTSASSTGTFAVPGHQQVSITLSSYLPTINTTAANTLNGLISGFQSAHPNIHVTLQNETSSAGIAGQVQQDEVSGQTPDVVQDSFNDLKFITKDLGAANLDEVVGKPNVKLAFGGKYQYTPAVTHLAEIGGSVYGLPWTLSTPVLFYNADLFVKAGLNPENPPTTWTQVQQDALQIKQKTGAEGLANGCVGAASGGSDWCLQALIYSAGGSVMNVNQTKLTFNSKGLISALSVMQQLANSGAMVNLSAAQYVQAWAAGNLAMVLNTSALTNTLVSADAGHFTMYASRLPKFGNDTAIPTNSGSALFMLSKSKIKREADWELMQWLTSPASETAITENIGYPPLRPSIAQQPQYLENWANANHFLTANLFQLEHIHPWLAYPGPNYAAITTILTNAATAVAFQSQDPTQTLNSAQSQATGLLK